MKKLLFPISSHDYSSTMGRICHLITDLSKYFIVEILTVSKDVSDDVSKKIDTKFPNIHVRIIEGQVAPVTYDLRNDLAKIFINYTYDMVVPGTDMKIWKTTAFDDFWGHIAGYTYPKITGQDADMILLPLMNYEEFVSEDVDAFYTSLLFDAKESGMKVVGYQIYPVFESNHLMSRLVDAIIVKKEYEKQFYLRDGIAAEKIWVLGDNKDIYSLSTIEDSYKNNLYNSQIEINRSELCITVFNHQRFRPQLREVFRVIRETGIPAVLFMVKRNYVVRELKEDEIIEGSFFEEIKKTRCRFYLVDHGGMVPTIMTSDVIICATYIAPLEFSAQNGKESLVYNPLNAPMPEVNGVTFIRSPHDLALSLKRAYKTKRDTVGMPEIINALLGEKI